MRAGVCRDPAQSPIRALAPTNGVTLLTGDPKRAMYAIGAVSVLDMILDPLFIYQAGMGIAGAAWGMTVPFALVSGVLFYWFFVQRDTYISSCMARSRGTGNRSLTSLA